MIGRMVKAVARAAVAQPWDYMGEGAPQEPEFRVSPNGRHFAAYDPARGTWLVHEAMSGAVVREIERQGKIDKLTRDWDQYLRIKDPEDT
jgi:hypothetical protein